jgi:hypothetical protein
VEEGMQIRKDITVIMCPNVLDPKYVRSIKEVLSTYSLIVHPRMIQTETVLNKQKLMPATGGHKAGVLNSLSLQR